ncbi:RUN and FYVE domain-containing protein 1 [Geodia barretti]|uniref:RUN and FYVE domain-containing protein 1 n=1 Tax=Geodia barretti TaxID=519541 RepID=A0AA35XB88_GEOBA|nr:RUN and FYVE domain-containing protein 1 [Geodia barretti]
MAASGEGEWASSREDGDTIILSVEGEREAKHRLVERTNILGIVNIVVKGLMETSMQQGKTLNDAHPQLQQCLVAVEQALKHGLRTKRSMLGQKKSFWAVVEGFEKMSTDFSESISNVRGLPGIKTAVGRGRAWLRFGVMQKKLGDYFRTMTDNKTKLREWYEEDSIMVRDEGQVLAGLLMGLNAIDYNMTLSAEEFDKSVGPLDLSGFLRDGNCGISGGSASRGAGDEEGGESGLAQLLDQKAYLEEHNRKLELSLEKVQTRLSVAECSVGQLEERVREEEEEVGRLRQERDDLREMNERSSAELRRALENLQDDQKAELETYVQTRAGLNDLYSATQRNLDTESRRRSQLEQELELLKTSRTEKETAMLLLEKSVHEKQDTIVGLRRQLEEVKTANLKMTSQLKTTQETHQRDSLKIRGIENKLSQTTANLKKADKELVHTTIEYGCLYIHPSQ